MNRYSDIDWSFKKLSPVYGFHTEKLVSLEIALKPIEAFIHGLPIFIKTAKKTSHYPNKHGLSKDQAASIYIYTMEWGETSLYRVLNRALRSENRIELKIWFPYLKLFDTALDLLPTVKGSVWRGIPIDIGKHFVRDQIFTWWSISSCSLSVDVIERFLGNEKNSTLFLIEIVNGKKIADYTEFQNEDEVILRTGTELCVKANPMKGPDGFLHVVHLIERIDDDIENQLLPNTGIDFNTEIFIKSNENTTITTASPTQTSSLKYFIIISTILMAVFGIIYTKNQQSQSYPRSRILRWKQNGTTIAGGNQYGDQLNQLKWPENIYIDDKQRILYIVDDENHRIMKWKLGENNGQIVAGGNGRGNRIDQLSNPTDIIVDQRTKYLIICDYGNKRVVRWSLENSKDKQIIISDIECWGLAMNSNGDMFVSNLKRNEVKIWRQGEKDGRIVAGGNGKGDKLNQLNYPTYIFVDHNDTIYVSDRRNHRVMKWMKDANKGIIVAGGHGNGNSFKQLSYPRGVIVNQLGDIYMADYGNDRVMCWPSESKEGRVVVGGNGRGYRADQFNRPFGLSFDIENNLYVVDEGNNRVQRFDIDRN